MNSALSGGSVEPEMTIRQRAASLREAAARHGRAASLDACLASARSYVNQFDFQAFSINELSRLYAMARHAHDYWGQVGALPLCVALDNAPGTRLTPLGWFVELEDNRMAFLRDRCVAELTKRTPADEDERDEILNVRIMHALECSGRVDIRDEPTLLVEALKAWG